MLKAPNRTFTQITNTHTHTHTHTNANRSILYAFELACNFLRHLTAWENAQRPKMPSLPVVFALPEADASRFLHFRKLHCSVWTGRFSKERRASGGGGGGRKGRCRLQSCLVAGNGRNSLDHNYPSERCVFCSFLAYKNKLPFLVKWFTMRTRWFVQVTSIS